jgi:hypothetical protein
VKANKRRKLRSLPPFENGKPHSILSIFAI